MTERLYKESMWTDTVAAMDLRSKEQSNFLVAATIYDAAIKDGGRFTVDGLVEDWKLNPYDAMCLLIAVRMGWERGRWRDYEGRGSVGERRSRSQWRPLRS